LFDRDNRRKLIQDGDGRPRGRSLVNPLPLSAELGSGPIKMLADAVIG
jgi:hypothetical protein